MHKCEIGHIHQLVLSTGCVARFIVFGSFVTNKPDPNDIDIFLLMNDSFDVSKIVGEPAVLFDHVAAQTMLVRAFSGCVVRPPLVGSNCNRALGAEARWRASRHYRNYGTMKQTDREYRTTLERVAQFQRQIEYLRKTETNPHNYRLSASGYLSELDRMLLEVREYLWSHPAEFGEPVRQ